MSGEIAFFFGKYIFYSMLLLGIGYSFFRICTFLEKKNKSLPDYIIFIVIFIFGCIFGLLLEYVVAGYLGLLIIKNIIPNGGIVIAATIVVLFLTERYCSYCRNILTHGQSGSFLKNNASFSSIAVLIVLLSLFGYKFYLASQKYSIEYQLSQQNSYSKNEVDRVIVNKLYPDGMRFDYIEKNGKTVIYSYTFTNVDKNIDIDANKFSAEAQAELFRNACADTETVRNIEGLKNTSDINSVRVNFYDKNGLLISSSYVEFSACQ